MNLACDSSFRQRWAVPIAVGLLFAWALWSDQVLAQSGGINCSQAVAIEGFNKLLGTVWGYLSGPVGKVIAIGLIIFGAASVIARNIGLGVASFVGAFVIAFSADIVRTLFASAAGAGTGC
jgi:type IV secretory pathway VirB2 component (pilin)